MALPHHLRYSSTIESGLALQPLDATACGDDAHINAYIERASNWVSNPLANGP